MLATYIALFVIHALVIAPLIYIWVKGIDNMKDNYPDYKGEDFFN
jgi:hypothetical protein